MWGTLVDCRVVALHDKAVEIEHGLYIKYLHWSFEHIPIISDGDLIEREVVFERTFLFSEDDSTPGRSKSGEYTVFSKING